MSAHPSDYVLDRGGPAVDAHLTACAACQARHHDALAAQAEFERRVLPATLPLIRERLARRRRWRVGFGFALPAVAAVALLLLARPRQQDPYTGIKGPSATWPSGIEVYVKRGASVFVLDPAGKIRPHDELRFRYRGERARHLEIRVVGADNQEHPFHPERGAAPLVQPGDTLPHAAVVDDAPGVERLVVRASDRPFGFTDDRPDIERHRMMLAKER
jgi:hypothetical protein